MTNTGASPAAPFAGIGAYTGPSPTNRATVYKLTPTVTAESGPLSGEVELEAWVTSQSIAATCCFDYNESTVHPDRANYNNSRSNRSTIRGPGDADSDGDGLTDGVETRSEVLELENQLLSQTKAAADSISKRSARTGREGIVDMGDTIRDIQKALERCSDDVCVTVREHADGRAKLTQQAAAHVDNGEWDRAAETLQEIQGIVEGDIELLESSLKDTDGEIILAEDRDMVMPDDNGVDIDALYEYLAGAPVINEQFTITVPDASLPGSDATLRDELTPRRIIEYITGRADEDGKVYSWGHDEVETGNGDGETSPLYEGERRGSDNPLNRGLMSDDASLYNSETFLSAVSGPVDTGIHLESHVVDGRVTVNPVNDPPTATDKKTSLAVSADGSSSAPADFDDWGSELGEGSTTSTLVCPIMVEPPECPLPFPALLYVSRCKNADQYIYTGGWVIDDSSLYEDSLTLVAVREPTAVIGVGAGDLDGDGYSDMMPRRLSDDRERRGARLFDGTVSDAVAEGVLSEAEGEDIILRKRPGRDADQQEEMAAADVPVTMSAQGRLLHFTDVNASDDVKFKAGAELSKSVN
ncbi:hypothetical protein [Halorubrum miltondacostae]|uniref:hypothetical protein n=1 Tax=Halorubrum miltondacostae TaxID=3076378 RepID=UPI003527E58C